MKPQLTYEDIVNLTAKLSHANHTHKGQPEAVIRKEFADILAKEFGVTPVNTYKIVLKFRTTADPQEASYRITKAVAAIPETPTESVEVIEVTL